MPLGKRILQFRAEAYNAFNHTQWSAVNAEANFDPAGRQVNTNFGRIIDTRPPRRMQMGIRLNFQVVGSGFSRTDCRWHDAGSCMMLTRRSVLAAAAAPFVSPRSLRREQRVERSRRPVPSPSQLEWQRDELAMFVHFGVNTFTDRERGDGREMPALFNPSRLDARQWARAARAGGFRAMILTAKHHDGFCLWPSRTTAHTVARSPWRSGDGDVVREFVAACRAEGLRAGLYLSPWDRHELSYGDSSSTRLCALFAALRLSCEIDSRPRNSALQPLRAASSMNSSSRAALAVHWLVQHFLSGVSAWKSSFAYRGFAPMLSSQNTTARVGLVASSRTTSSTGR